MNDLIKTKVGVLFGLLVATLIAGFLPLLCLLRPSTRTRDIVSLCNSFAGGVFLGTFLLHMLPEAAENMEAALDLYHIHIGIPFSEFLVAMGFFLILIAELLAHRFYHPAAAGIDLHDHTQGSEAGGLLRNSNSRGGVSETPGEHRGALPGSFESSAEHVLHEPQESILSSLVFLLALSLHSVFEGMAIGLQDHISGVLEVFLGVVLHKIVIVFSFSLNLLHNRVKVSSLIIYVVLLAIASPLGVGIGIGIPSDSPSSAMANGVLQSLAAGTFLFIIFFEILPGELRTDDVTNKTFLKMVLLLAGFGVMTGLQFLDHDHDH